MFNRESLQDFLPNRLPKQSAVFSFKPPATPQVPLGTFDFFGFPTDHSSIDSLDSVLGVDPGPLVCLEVLTLHSAELPSQPSVQQL